MLRLRRRHWWEMAAHAWSCLPEEACGLLVGRDDRVERFLPCRNADASSRTFSIGPDGWRLADGVTEETGLEVIGVMHSHTHTPAYPSPTDVERAGNPLLSGWWWLLVSLADGAPVVRVYRIHEGIITEGALDVVGR